MPKDNRMCPSDMVPFRRNAKQILKAVIISVSYAPIILIPSLEKPIADAYSSIPCEGTPKADIHFIQREEDRLNSWIRALGNNRT